MVFQTAGLKFPSLSAIVCSLTSKITREGLHKRFTASAVEFLEQITIIVFNHKIKVNFNYEIFQPFTSVLLIDSTFVQLAPELMDTFPGFGGSGSDACVRIQLVYDYLKGAMSFFDITAGTKNDVLYAKAFASKVKQGALILCDLGYYSTEFFQAITKQKAFFISRLKSDCKIFHPETKKEISLFKLLKKFKYDKFTLDVLIGYRTKMPCRLIVSKVPREVAEKRRRDKKMRALKRKSQAKESTLILCDWTLLITNTSEDILAAEKVYDVYKLRWQIELIFKQFKSVMNFNNVATRRKERFLCELYGKLILACLITKLYRLGSFWEWQSNQRELSFDKFCKRIQERLIQIASLLVNVGLRATLVYLERELNLLVPNCLKQKQRSRCSTLETVLKPLTHNCLFIPSYLTAYLS